MQFQSSRISCPHAGHLNFGKSGLWNPVPPHHLFSAATLRNVEVLTPGVSLDSSPVLTHCKCLRTDIVEDSITITSHIFK